MGAPDGVSRAVHPVCALHGKAARPVEVSYVPAEVAGSPLASATAATLDRAFRGLHQWIPALEEHFRVRYPKSPEDTDGVYKAVIRAKALDTLRGLLPAATTSNVGLFGTGQAYEALLLRMFAHPLAEVRATGALMLSELRKVIPAFLVTSRSGRTRCPLEPVHLSDAREATLRRVAAAVADQEPEAREEVTLTEFDPDGEIKVAASILYAQSALPDDQLMAIARRMSADERKGVVVSVCRRSHEPAPQAGSRVRAHALSLRRHRRLRRLPRPSATPAVDPRVAGTDPHHGYVEPAALEEAGALAEWREVMSRSAELHERHGVRGVARSGRLRGRHGLPRAVLHGHERA